jgi:hypothetical protein
MKKYIFILVTHACSEVAGIMTYRISIVNKYDMALRTLWTPPYRVDLSDVIQQGINTLAVEVTGTWFNWLVYDANLPETERKTWTISGPAKEAALRERGLLGPVVLYTR